MQIADNVLDGIQGRGVVDLEPELEAVNQSAPHIFAGDRIDVVKGLQQRRIGLVERCLRLGVVVVR